MVQSSGAQPVPPKGPAGPSVGKLGDVKCARGDGFRLPSVRSKQSKGISDKWLILRDRSSDSPANSLVKPARPAKENASWVSTCKSHMMLG